MDNAELRQENTVKLIKKKQEEPKWFILTSLEPQDTLWQLEQRCKERQAEDGQVWRYFVPYRFLDRKIAYDLPEREGEDMEKEGYHNPLSKARVKESNSIRTTLKRFVFVNAKESELAEFLAEDWNRLAVKHVQFYRSVNLRRVSVEEQEMERFIKACEELKFRFELFPALDDLRQGEEVILNTTGFHGEKARVLTATRTRHGLKLTLVIELFANTMILRLPNVSEKDIIRQTGVTDETDDRHFIDRIQNQLLQILARVVNRKQTDETKAEDAATLEAIYERRIQYFSNEAANRHFLALMLICACLRHDKNEIRQLTEAAAIELNTINKKSESKAATDVRAYLQVALYLATWKPEYRNAAKKYVADHNPSSQPLRQFVKLIRKGQKI